MHMAGKEKKDIVNGYTKQIIFTISCMLFSDTTYYNKKQ